MTHLDEGRLQAYLDDEMAGRDRATAAEHILLCGDCRTQLDELRDAGRVFSSAVAELDVAPPATARRTAGRSGGPHALGSMARAAVLVLLFAAAASALVPGSPVPAWIAGALGNDAEEAAVETPAPAEPSVTRPAPVETAQPAGISLPVDGRIEVAIEDMADAAIRLVRVTGGSVSVSAVGGDRDPVFRTEAGRIEVAQGAGGQIVVELPMDGDARLTIDGRVYAEQVGGRLDVLVPGEETEGGVIWR